MSNYDVVCLQSRKTVLPNSLVFKIVLMMHFIIKINVLGDETLRYFQVAELTL